MEERYLIIADDFTGANDTGVQLKRRGYPTEVLFAGKKIQSCKSIVIDTESRQASPRHAYEIVRQSLGQMDFPQFRYVIKKVDSTMRGNIPEEIKAVDEAYHPDLVVFAPALPALGRTTMDGVQRLNGVGICKTELSKDPKNPVMEDNLVKLLEHVYDEPVMLKYLPDVRSRFFSFDGGRIFVCDAKTDQDLKKIILAAKQSGRRTLYIGTSGLADNMMETESPSLPALGVVASVSSVANAQMRYCEKAGYAMVKVPVAKLVDGSACIEEYQKAVVESLRDGKDTILLTDSAYDRELLELSQEAGEQKGMELTEVGDFVRSLFGKAAREILVGIPMVKVRGGRYDGLKLVTKAGAFGAEDAAAFALRKIKERNMEL